MCGQHATGILVASSKCLRNKLLLTGCFILKLEYGQQYDAFGALNSYCSLLALELELELLETSDVLVVIVSVFSQNESFTSKKGEGTVSVCAHVCEICVCSCSLILSQKRKTRTMRKQKSVCSSFELLQEKGIQSSMMNQMSSVMMNQRRKQRSAYVCASICALALVFDHEFSQCECR